MLSSFSASLIRERFNRIDKVALISISLILVFGLTLFTVYFFPVYSDEIQVRFWLSRLPYDFPEKISGAPACASTFFMSIPTTMYLPGIIDWVIHGRLDSIPALRIVGILVALLWITGLAFYLGNRLKGGLRKGNSPLRRSLPALYISGLIIAIFSIGVFPIFLVTNRNEQLILPCVILLIAIFLVSGRSDSKENLWQKMGLIALFFVAVSLILNAHAKGLFLTPLFVVVAWRLFSLFKSRLPLVFGMALLVLHISQAYFVFKYAFQCSELPQFELALKGYSFDPASLFYDPLLFFKEAYGSFIRFTKYLVQLGFQEHTDAAYLPPIVLSIWAKLSNVFIYCNVAALFFSLMIGLPFQYYRKDLLTRRFLTINLVLLILFTCTLISAIFNLPKNWYDAGYLYALLLIILIFFMGENFTGVPEKPIYRKIFIYMGLVALLSQAVFAHRNLPAFLHGYTGPGVSIAKYDAIQNRNDIIAASQACNIDPERSKKIVVDDGTYLYFQKSKWPMAITYIWQIPDDKSIRQFFSKIDSDGLIVRCTGLLDPYLPYVKREGGICCIPKDKLKNLSSLP